MIRSFMPVGQGGFAVEQFWGGETVVFDCGTETAIGKMSAKKILQRQIDKISRSIDGLRMDRRDARPVIDKIFVSHFHRDHFNGLPLLLDKFQVNTVYMPYLTPSEQVISLILMNEYLDDKNGKLFQNLITGRGFDSDEYSNTRAIYVSSQETDNIGNGNYRREIISSGEVISSNDIYEIGEPWIYIPYTFNNEKRTERFLEKLYANGIGDDIQDKVRHSEFWRDKKMRDIFKNAYERICSDINLTTMVVYSGTERMEKEYICHGRQIVEKIGCLYMGDYSVDTNPAWDDLRRAYDNIWGNIGICTVPHHGSKNNYNFTHGLIDSNTLYIINAGCKNKHGHPDKEVLDDLVNRKCNIIWVNELESSGSCFYIYNRKYF